MSLNFDNILIGAAFFDFLTTKIENFNNSLTSFLCGMLSVQSL